jgi:ATP-binding cassette subfamily C protein CydC
LLAGVVLAALALGGIELPALDQDAVRSQIAVVTQQTYLFNATVRQSLLIARPSASDAELIAATRRARQHDVIADLPQGYETPLGEQGLRLSDGERQRVAIARAILKDVPIFILDEATANLDPLSARDVLAALASLQAGRTTVRVTHRLVEMEAASEILVLDAGHVVEHGTHGSIASPQRSLCAVLADADGCSTISSPTQRHPCDSLVSRPPTDVRSA